MTPRNVEGLPLPLIPLSAYSLPGTKWHRAEVSEWWVNRVMGYRDFPKEVADQTRDKTPGNIGLNQC